MTVREFKCRSAAERINGLLKGFWRRAVPLFPMPLVLIVLVLVPAMVYAQKGDFFSVSSIMRDVKSEFKLNRGDVRRLGPLIENENFDVLMIYVRFGGGEPEYSRAIWRDVISRRMEFESRGDPKLTANQRSALRSARTALERRVLEFLMGDYVFFLSNILELDGPELEAIEHLFNKEIRRKHKLVLSYLKRSSQLQTELDQASRETEYWLARILTPDQLRIYRSIAIPDDNLIG